MDIHLMYMPNYIKILRIQVFLVITQSNTNIYEKTRYQTHKTFICVIFTILQFLCNSDVMVFYIHVYHSLTIIRTYNRNNIHTNMSYEYSPMFFILLFCIYCIDDIFCFFIKTLLYLFNMYLNVQPRNIVYNIIVCIKYMQ